MLHKECNYFSFPQPLYAILHFDQPINAMEVYLTIDQVAEIVNVKPRTIRSWIEKRQITFTKLPGGDIRIEKEWLNNWLKVRTVKAQISVKVN